MTPLWAIMVVLVANLIGAVGALFLKFGSGRARLSLRSIIYNPKLIFGFVCHGVGAVIFVIMLKFGELSVLYALSSTTYVWVAIFSKLFLKEKIPLLRVVGILGIIVGVIIVVV